MATFTGNSLLTTQPGTETGNPILKKERRLFEYWLKHKVGADFICVDKGIKDYHDKNTYTADELLSYTPTYQQLCKQIRQMTDLPIWWAEYYGIGGKKQGLTPAQNTLAFASIYHHMILGQSNVGLLWNPNDGEVAHALFTDVRNENGGKPLPHAQLFAIINKHFSKGTPIYPIRSSDHGVEALVSSTHALLINKHDHAIHLNFESKTLKLPAYSYKLISRN